MPVRRSPGSRASRTATTSSARSALVVVVGGVVVGVLRDLRELHSEVAVLAQEVDLVAEGVHHVEAATAFLHQVVGHHAQVPRLEVEAVAVVPDRHFETLRRELEVDTRQYVLAQFVAVFDRVGAGLDHRGRQLVELRLAERQLAADLLDHRVGNAQEHVGAGKVDLDTHGYGPTPVEACHSVAKLWTASSSLLYVSNTEWSFVTMKMLSIRSETFRSFISPSLRFNVV